jgi:hypothetical protein
MPHADVACGWVTRRYLSTPLFAEIGADMNDEETEISQSTPGQHMPEA